MPDLLVRCCGWFAILALMCCAGSLANGQQPLDAKGIERAVRELGDDEYAIREAASKKLWLAGIAADAALRKAAESDDAEIRQRARVILEKFELGLTPDMSPEFEALVINFKQSDANGKQTVLQELIKQKKIKTALQLARGEKEAPLRQSLLNTASLLAQRFLPELLVAEEVDEAESILDTIEQSDTAIERLTAMLLITGRLKDRAKKAEEDLTKSTSPALVKRVVYFRRASGDLAGAAQLAGEHQLPTYQRAILLESADWKGAAAVQQKLLKESSGSIEAACYGAALHFFAGNQDAAQELLASVRTRTAEQVSAYWDAAEVHLVCEEPELALELLKKSLPAGASHVHYLRLEFEPSQTVAGVTKETKFDRAWYNTLTDGGLVATQMRVPRAHFARDIARHMHRIGEREKAKEIAAIVRSVAQEDKSGPWWPTVLQTDLYLHDRAQALVDLQQALNRPGIAQSQLFGVLYPQDFVVAEALYAALGTAAEKQAKSLATIEKLFGPAGYSDEERGELASEVTKAIEPWFAAADYRQHMRGAEVLLRLEDRAGARRWLEKAGTTSTDAYVRLGDLAREEKNWTDAIKWYQLACDKLPGLSLPRYLLGQSMIDAGNVQAGKREQSKASLTALAPITRYALAFQLKERGLTKAAAEQALILQQTSNPTVQHPTLAAGHLRSNLLMDDSPAEAADGWQRWLLSQLSGVNNYALFDHYLTDPELIHRRRARVLLAAGKSQEAIAELRRVQVIMPGNVRMLEEFVPLLDKAGLGKEADELLAFTIGIYAKVLRDHPQTAYHRRELALLYARSNLRRDEALRLIQEAIKLDPGVALNHDALAEIQFLRGDKAAAIAAGKKALELERRTEGYVTRLARWQGKE